MIDPDTPAAPVSPAKKKRLCIVCRERPAAVPDRNRMGRPINRVCRECHGRRLAGDAIAILKTLKQEPPTP